MPTIEEIATRLNGAKLFRVFYASSGFWRVELDEEFSMLTLPFPPASEGGLLTISMLDTQSVGWSTFAMTLSAAISSSFPWISVTIKNHCQVYFFNIVIGMTLDYTGLYLVCLSLTDYIQGCFNTPFGRYR